MAILKHRSSKNSNYNDIVDYLLYEHDESTNKPIYDENGDMIPREEYYIDGINCEPESFAIECRELNRKWNKNQKPGDVKSHQYILSFDPDDVSERGLTGQKVQELAMEFAQRNFPGHQILVCTHVDGHNKSGNIHAHIVLNSLRKYDVPEEDCQCYIGRKSDLKAGTKHHQTKESLEFLKRDVMEMCQREDLNQVDLINKTAHKQTEKEYYAKQNGQKRMDKEAEQNGTSSSKFQTQKDYLRNAIDACAYVSKSLAEFEKMLKDQFNIDVRISRGVISYHHPDRKQNVRGRTLGANYELDYLNSLFVKNELDNGIQSKDPNDNNEHHNPHLFDKKYDYSHDPVAAIYIVSGIRLIADIQVNMKTILEAQSLLEGVETGEQYQEVYQKLEEQKELCQQKVNELSQAVEQVQYDLQETIEDDPQNTSLIRDLRNKYEDLNKQKDTAQFELYHCFGLQSQVKLQRQYGIGEVERIMEKRNEKVKLKVMAETVVWLQKRGYLSETKLKEVLGSSQSKRESAQKEYQETSEKLEAINKEIKYMGRYLSTKSVQKSFLSASNKGAFRNAHKKELDAYNNAVKHLREIHSDGKFSTMADLKAQQTDLKIKVKEQYQGLKYFSDQENDLETAYENLEEILHPTGKADAHIRSRIMEREHEEDEERNDMR